MIGGLPESRTRFASENEGSSTGVLVLFNRILCGFLFILTVPETAISVSGQPAVQYDVQHLADSSIPGVRNFASNHYTLVALRVEFQADSSRFSTGDGRFDGVLFEGSTDPPTLDPLPHDEAYFDAHLTFLSNYVRRVSSGRTTLTTVLLPQIIQVSKPMGAYAPTGFQAEFDTEKSKLAALVAEVWTIAGDDPAFSLPTGLDPEHTAFVIFHAGVGRDIELLGNTLDKTPEDLPSLFFDSDLLARLTGKDHFDVNGFPVSNSMIIPRTETRRATNFLGEDPFLVELSINGMLAASFLNYLGVPDLFNTSSGQSAIGPFGVMDGLGIFAFSGLIPPEPSAWTKLYLGWADMIFPEGGLDQSISLVQAGDPSRSDVFVAPVSSAEYFLVENRNRDPEGDGIHLQVYTDGKIEEVVFKNGDPGFNSQTISGYPGGVVTDVDNLDFVLPGGLDVDGGELNGGILIWHIDERRLRAGLATNSVNADSSRRAVDLEEADSGQDIGFPSVGQFGPSFENGSPFDYFYDGNPFSVITATGREIRLYQNRFGPDTFPSSRPNEGGSAFVELTDFSVPGPVMQFIYRRVPGSNITERPGDGVELGFGEDFSISGSTDFGIPDSTPDGTADVSSGGADGVLRYVGSPGIDYLGFGVDSMGTGRLFVTKTGSIAATVTGLLSARPAISAGAVIAASRDGFVGVSPSGEIRALHAFPPALDIVRSTSAVVALLDGSVHVAVETTLGPELLSLTDSGFQRESLSSPVRSLSVVDRLRLALVFNDHAEIRSTGAKWNFDPIDDQIPFQAFFWRSESESFDSRVTGVVPDRARRRLDLLLEDGTISTINMDDYLPFSFGGILNMTPVVVDLDGDHHAEIVVTAGKWLFAFHSNGVLLDSFPIRLRTSSVSQPLVGRFSNGGSWAAILASEDGQIDAYDLSFSDRRVPGFPLPVGARNISSPMIRDGVLAGLSATGSLTVWDAQGLNGVIWGEAFGLDNANFVELSDPAPGASGQPGETGSFVLLPKEKTYNWPNPVVNGVTRIRVEPGSRTDVQILIVNAAGTLIDELEMKGIPPGIASEVEWRTDAASGLYIARVTATSGNRVESRLIKIAIIR